MKVLCVFLFSIMAATSTSSFADPAMPPLCSARAEIVSKDETDASFMLRILDVHGIFSTLSCEGKVPRPGEVIRTSSYVLEEFNLVKAGCVISAAISPSRNTAGVDVTKWEDLVADCPMEKKLLRHSFTTE